MSWRLTKILGDLDRHKQIFDLDQNGLGEALMNIDCEVILRDMDAEVDPDGKPWPPLSELYLAWKAIAAPGSPMAVLYGHMKTLAQLKGMRRTTARLAVMVYGIDEEARDLAEWFQEGNAKQNRPPRRFYLQSAEAQQLKDEYCRNHLTGRV